MKKTNPIEGERLEFECEWAGMTHCFFNEEGQCGYDFFNGSENQRVFFAGPTAIFVQHLLATPPTESQGELARDRVVDFLLDQVWFDPESSSAEKQIDSITELLSGTPQPKVDRSSSGDIQAVPSAEASGLPPSTTGGEPE